MNCEFQSMQIAQQKLSVTRDLQRAAEDYQNSLNATKLVWDCDTVDNDIYNLSYDLMMNPSAINEYDPYLITDTRGRIVLNEKMWNAAVASGIIDGNGDPVKSMSFNENGRNQFLDQLGVQGAASFSVIDAIKNLGSDGYTNSGVGGEIIDKTIASIMNTSTFINYMKNTKYEEDVANPAYDPNDPSKGPQNFHNKGDYIYGVNLFSDTNNPMKNTSSTVPYNITQSTRTTLGFNSKDKNTYIISKNGSVVSPSTSKNLSLGEILSGKYTFTYKGDGQNDDKEFVTIVKDILTQMAETLGYGKNYTDNDACGLCATQAAQDALETAYQLTLEQMNSVDDFQDGTTNPSQNATKAQECNTGIGTGNIWSISISNMLNSFLTNFAIALEGYDCGLNIDKTSYKDSNYVSKYLDYNFEIVNDSYPEQDMLYADFYNQLYNQICMNGACNDATKRAKVTDNTYLTNALKNGQLFVSTLNTDGYFYQGHYTASGHISEVTDEDAVAQAELEYNVTKSRLNTKEESLELQMKNLDMEISALSTEYDTVKSLISNGIEKVFTMFSS